MAALVGACGVGDDASRTNRVASVLDRELSPGELEAALKERLAQRLSERPNTEIKGRIVASDDSPLAGVRVQTGKLATETDLQGNFVLSDVPYGVYIVSFEHPSYVFTQRTVAAQYESMPDLAVSMLKRSAPQLINVDQQAEFVQGPLKLVFKPGDLVLERNGLPVHGNVEVMATTIEPGKKGHIEAAPALLEGYTENGQITALASLGMFEVEILQKGERVQVRQGGSVELRMQLTKAAGVNEASTVPLWHHDHKLGMWVQLSGVQAQPKGVSKNGLLEFAAAVPHFSAWNFDLPNKSICVYSFYPNVTGFRTVSTFPGLTTADGLWSIEGECMGRGCVGNAPSGWAGGAVSFKFQARIATNQGEKWCDAPMMLNANQIAQITVTGADLQAYALRINGTTSTDSYCGTSLPPGFLNPGLVVATGAYASWQAQSVAAAPNGFGLSLTPADTNANGQVNDDMSCPDGAMPNSTASDPGFTRMVANAKLETTFRDTDRDGLNDAVDRCPLRSNNNACSAGCFVSPSDPNRALFDFDLDTVDDFCDTKFTTYNPTQNNGL